MVGPHTLQEKNFCLILKPNNGIKLIMRFDCQKCKAMFQKAKRKIKNFSSYLFKYHRVAVWSHRGIPGVTRCQEMATLPAGYIPQRKVPEASSSGSLGFIVCVKCCRMVDSVPIRHTISIL